MIVQWKLGHLTKIGGNGGKLVKSYSIWLINHAWSVRCGGLFTKSFLCVFMERNKVKVHKCWKKKKRTETGPYMFLLAPSRGTCRVSRKLNSLIPSRSIITYLFHPAKWLYQSILPFCKLSSQNSFGVLFLLLSKLSWKLSLFFFWFKNRHLRRTAYQKTVLIFFLRELADLAF